MWIFRWPTSLWFLVGGGAPAGAVEVSVSVNAKLSCAVDQISSVDIELSTFHYRTSADVFFTEGGGATSEVMVGIDLDDNAYSTVDLNGSITPVFVIDQSGQTSVSATFALTASASITASIGIDVVPSVTYQLSASLSASLLIAENICVSVNYNITASIGVLLQVQLGQEDKNVGVNYALSASLTPILQIVNRGGLVWSMKKQKYIAVRVGSVPI